MGLFSFLVGHKVAKNRARKRHAEFDADICDDDICENCGYEAHRHSDEGDCPMYL